MGSTGIPHVHELTPDSLPKLVTAINAQIPNPRLRFILDRLVIHLLAFTRETQLTYGERDWFLKYVVSLGESKEIGSLPQIVEFEILCDIFGMSMMMDISEHPRPAGATAGTLLGPVYLEGTEEIEQGKSIIDDEAGEPLLVTLTVKTLDGHPIEGAKIEVWEADSQGLYDIQKQQGHNGRATLKADASGECWFMASTPKGYPIPPISKIYSLMNETLHRHAWRATHMHFLISAPSYDTLVTQLYMSDDPYITSDCTFAVYPSLVVDKIPATQDTANRYGVKVGSNHLHYDFVVPDSKLVNELRVAEAKRQIEDLGFDSWKIYEGLPVPDVD